MRGYRTEDDFELPVRFKDKEILLSATMAAMGYTYKIFVQVEDQEIIFEPDEERKLRAVMDPEKGTTKISPELVRAIGEALEKHFR